MIAMHRPSKGPRRSQLRREGHACCSLTSEGEAGTIGGNHRTHETFSENSERGFGLTVTPRLRFTFSRWITVDLAGPGKCLRVKQTNQRRARHVLHAPLRRNLQSRLNALPGRVSSRRERGPAPVAGRCRRDRRAARPHARVRRRVWQAVPRCWPWCGSNPSCSTPNGGLAFIRCGDEPRKTPGVPAEARPWPALRTFRHRSKVHAEILHCSLKNSLRKSSALAGDRNPSRTLTLC